MISVIISTRDRADKLRLCLSSLGAARRPPGVEVEIVVVDNGSSDHTAAVVDEAGGGIPVRYVHEPATGLSRGKNRGIGEACGDLVAFVDDDCVVAEDWYEVLAEEFADPSLDCCGGRVELFDPDDAPVSIRTSTVRTPVDSVHRLFWGLPGSNLAVRKAAIERVGGFDVRLGAGTPIGSAEDTDFIYRLMRDGRRLLYVPTLVIYHAHGRRGEAEILTLNKGYVRGRGAFYCKHMLRGSWPIARIAVREVYELFLETTRLTPARRTAPTAPHRLKQLFAGAAAYVGLL